ncbi:hypothetical protein [Sorangium cellulosum]|uniref:hypothetical protein n=1 Tax=Sorangium cellulosum TaxID=56 RepID=UPI00040C6654|nr:hypothetical protein [Sorangium cellulosum]
MTDRAPADIDGPEPAAAGRPEPAEDGGREPAAADRPAPAGPDATSPPREPADAEPRRRTKKRAKRRDEKEAPPPGDAAPGRPRHPEIERLEQAFERGDYALVRAGARRLLTEGIERSKPGREPPEEDHPYRARDEGKSSQDLAEQQERERDEIRRAARALLRRIDPDPLAVALLVAAAALLVFLSLWYWSHSHVSP